MSLFTLSSISGPYDLRAEKSAIRHWTKQGSAWSSTNPRCAIQTPELLEKLEEKTQRNEENQSEKEQLSVRKIRTVSITLTGVLAGIYAIATFALGAVSYGVLNLRLSNILIGAAPMLGWPGVFGIALGVFLGNIGSPLGPIDLVSSIFSLMGLSAIHLLRGRSVLAGLTIYSIILTFWVSFEISYVYHLEYMSTFYAVLPGICVVTMGLAYLFYMGLVRTGLRRRVESVFK